MEYLAALAEQIERLHGVTATHVATVPVWDGDVEVFSIEGHPQTGYCYAWGYEADDGSGLHGVTLLMIPPVTDPKRAVRVYIASLGKGRAHEGRDKTEEG